MEQEIRHKANQEKIRNKNHPVSAEACGTHLDLILSIERAEDKEAGTILNGSGI